MSEEETTMTAESIIEQLARSLAECIQTEPHEKIIADARRALAM